MSNIEILEKLEKKLRKPENDRDYLADHLVKLAFIVAHGKLTESGMVRGALGGMTYAINRLREIWAEEAETPSTKSTEELAEIYAGVQLQRYTTDREEITRTAEGYKRDCMLVDVATVKIDEDTTYYVFVSRQDQTTVDGRKVLKGELLDAKSSPVPSFDRVFLELQKELNKPTSRPPRR